MGMIRLLPLWLSLSLLAASAPAAEPLRVGMELSYPPFEMTDTTGRPAGVSVRLAEALAADLGRSLVIENIAFDGLIPALKTKKIDCIISSMTATPERARSIAFSEPYLKTGLALLVGASSPVESAADLDTPGRVVAVGRCSARFARRPGRSGSAAVTTRSGPMSTISSSGFGRRTASSGSGMSSCRRRRPSSSGRGSRFTSRLLAHARIPGA